MKNVKTIIFYLVFALVSSASIAEQVASPVYLQEFKVVRQLNDAIYNGFSFLKCPNCIRHNHIWVEYTLPKKAEDGILVLSFSDSSRCFWEFNLPFMIYPNGDFVMFVKFQPPILADRSQKDCAKRTPPKWSVIAKTNDDLTEINVIQHDICLLCN